MKWYVSWPSKQSSLRAFVNVMRSAAIASSSIRCRCSWPHANTLQVSPLCAHPQPDEAAIEMSISRATTRQQQQQQKQQAREDGYGTRVVDFWAVRLMEGITFQSTAADSTTNYALNYLLLRQRVT